MQFSTRVPIQKSDRQIDYESEVFSVGSCFAVNIAEKLTFYQFKNVVNPTGILFNPNAIRVFFDRVASNTLFSESDIFFHNERWQCYETHSEVSQADQNQFLDALNGAIATSRNRLSVASHIIITLGTAWVYRRKLTNDIVANCHKVQQSEFLKEIMSVDAISTEISGIIKNIRQLNQAAHIVFTISPVRHLKDGFAENQRSKSNLIAALHQSIDGDASVNYFPSYEIMMDELRDYRFYNADMIHPNEIAIGYIWERFSEAYISPRAQKTATEVGEIRRSLNHRPFNAKSDSHQLFLQKLGDRIKKLQSQFPHIKF